jgi:mono/diheme cytochrome c family protein
MVDRKIWERAKIIQRRKRILKTISYKKEEAKIISKEILIKRMKKTFIITTFIITTAVAIISCGGGPRRDPGRIYMPDMAYSRAYETYAQHDSAIFFNNLNNPSSWGHKIFYNSQPVNGTIKRGELERFTVVNDSNGLLIQSALVKNPLPALSKPDSIEAGRLFNIYCAVCHGAKAESNGPVAAKIGGVKSIIASSPSYSDGRLFYVMTYGQGNMGSYASQLDRKQRWMIVQYIRSLEPKTTAAPTAATVAKTDTVKTK